MTGRVVRVIGYIDPEATRWALTLNRPESGCLALAVPAAPASATALLGEVMKALGKPARVNSLGVPSADLAELVRAWLIAHRIDRMIVVHADWLASPEAAQLCAIALLAGIRVDCVVTGGGASDPFQAWSGHEIGWVGFVEEWTRQAATLEQLAADPTRSQQSPVPRVGVPVGTEPVPPARTLVGPAMAAYVDALGRVRRDGRTEHAVSRAVEQVLHRFPHAELPQAVSGIATALLSAGWSITIEPGATDQGRTASWSALRSSYFPYLPATVALLSAGLWPEEATEIVKRDVARDGSHVNHRGRRVEIEPGARLYLTAQRLLLDSDEEPFLSHRGQALSANAIRSSAVAALGDIGVVVARDRLVRPSTASLRSLASRGLTIRRLEEIAPEVTKTRLCRHGLPAILEVVGVKLSHSQKLCRVGGNPLQRPWEVRPAEAGYELTETERSSTAVRYVVSRHGEPAGEIVGIYKHSEPIWVQVNTGSAPTAEQILDALASAASVST